MSQNATESLRTAHADLQLMELFDIKSSVQKGEGPYPRMLKRNDDRYVLPRSPESPTLRTKREPNKRSYLTSGSAHRCTKDSSISVDGLSVNTKDSRNYRLTIISYYMAASCSQNI